jgi:hypothetical protein
LLRNREHLLVAEQIVENPKWIEEAAQNSLGMIIVRQDRIILAPIDNWDISSSKNALLGNLIRPDEPRKPYSLN